MVLAVVLLEEHGKVLISTGACRRLPMMTNTAFSLAISEQFRGCFVSFKSRKIDKLYSMSSKNTYDVVGTLRHLMWSRLNLMQPNPGPGSCVPNPSEGPQTGEPPAEIRKVEDDKCNAGTGADTTTPVSSCMSPSSEPADEESDEEPDEESDEELDEESDEELDEGSPQPWDASTVCCGSDVLGGEPVEGGWEHPPPCFMGCPTTNANTAKEQYSGANDLACNPAPGRKRPSAQTRLSHYETYFDFQMKYNLIGIEAHQPVGTEIIHDSLIFIRD